MALAGHAQAAVGANRDAHGRLGDVCALLTALRIHPDVKRRAALRRAHVHHGPALQELRLRQCQQVRVDQFRGRRRCLGHRVGELAEPAAQSAATGGVHGGRPTTTEERREHAENAAAEVQGNVAASHGNSFGNETTMECGKSALFRVSGAKNRGRRKRASSSQTAEMRKGCGRNVELAVRFRTQRVPVRFFPPLKKVSAIASCLPNFGLNDCVIASISPIRVVFLMFYSRNSAGSNIRSKNSSNPKNMRFSCSQGRPLRWVEMGVFSVKYPESPIFGNRRGFASPAGRPGRVGAMGGTG